MNIAVLYEDKSMGKTTWLMNQISRWNFVGGILSPDQGSRRMFYDIEKKKYFEFELDSNSNEDTYDIGRFRFSKNSFELANKILKTSFENNVLTILDEFGPLEMQGLGFAPIIFPILKFNRSYSSKFLLIVLRTNLINEFQIKFPGVSHFISLAEAQDKHNNQWEYLFR